MKTDQLNLNQLLRYGFCGMFLFVSFMYGRGGMSVFEKHSVMIKDHAVLLTSSFFGAGALLYTLYRALIYPYLGRLAFWVTFDLPDKENTNVRWLKTRHQRWHCMLPILFVLVVAAAACCIFSVRGITTTIVIICVVAFLWLKTIQKTISWRRHLSLVSMPEKEMQSDRERWQSKLNETGAQCLEEWASQIHMLYTTALALWFGSVAGAWWPSESVSIAFSKMSPSPLGCLFIAVLFLQPLLLIAVGATWKSIFQQTTFGRRHTSNLELSAQLR